MNKYRVIDCNGFGVIVEADGFDANFDTDANPTLALYIGEEVVGDPSNDLVAVFNGFISCCKVAE